MKIQNLKTQAAAIALVAAAGLTGCAANTSSGSSAAPNHAASRAYLGGNNLPADGVAIDGYCPVAYFAVHKPVKGEAQYSSTHEGVTYHLVSADAKAAFDADPEKYVPAYGGWCAFGMAVQDKFPVDPHNFAIVDGRLMLFLKNDGIDARELWRNGDAVELQRKADKHWAKVQG